MNTLCAQNADFLNVTEDGALLICNNHWTLTLNLLAPTTVGARINP